MSFSNVFIFHIYSPTFNQPTISQHNTLGYLEILIKPTLDSTNSLRSSMTNQVNVCPKCVSRSSDEILKCPSCNKTIHAKCLYNSPPSESKSPINPKYFPLMFKCPTIHYKCNTCTDVIVKTTLQTDPIIIDITEKFI